MVSSSILYRTFRIKYKDKVATAFTIEKGNVQYIVTAKHLFYNVCSGNKVTIAVLNSYKYNEVSVEVLFHKNDALDCAVLKLTPYKEITKRFSNENTLDGVVLGQDVYFLGFPYNYDDILSELPQTAVPVPFVKKACLSGISKDRGTIFLDGINNPGFSGGPVCFKDSKTGNFKIAGLINGYQYTKIPVYSADNNIMDYYIRENTGIIYACSIQKVFEVIDFSVD